MRILPWMLPVFSFTMPAALVVYFVISNLYRIGQQGYITRRCTAVKTASAQARRCERKRKPRKTQVGRKQAGGRTTPKKGEPTPKRADAGGDEQKSSRGVAPAEPARRPLAAIRWPNH